MIALSANRRLWNHKSVRALIRSGGGGDPIEGGTAFRSAQTGIIARDSLSTNPGIVFRRSPVDTDGRATALAGI